MMHILIDCALRGLLLVKARGFLVVVYITTT